MKRSPRSSTENSRKREAGPFIDIGQKDILNKKWEKKIISQPYFDKEGTVVKNCKEGLSLCLAN